MIERVAVVGGGATGALVTVQLLRSPEPPAAIELFESTSRPIGQGVAYSTQQAVHVLNTPHEVMSIDAADEADFTTWLGGAPAARERFRPRAEYGRYLTERFGAVSTPTGTVRVHRDAVVDARRAGRGWRVVTAGGTTLSVDAVVLACGWLPPRIPIEVDAAAAPHVIADPWSAEVAQVDPHNDVVLLGSALTAVDDAVQLQARGHEGRVVMLSRHALLPIAHPADPSAAVAPTPDHVASTARDVVRAARDVAASVDGDLDAFLGSVRPWLSTVWPGLANEERSRLLRHVLRRWEIHRHRMAPSAGDQVAAMRASGQLTVQRFRARRVDASAGGLVVSSNDGNRVVCATLVVCTGRTIDVRNTDDPLLRSLLDRGVACADRLGIGLLTRDGGAVVDADGRADPTLRVAGPLRRSESWESTAVSDIRGQAAEIARSLNQPTSVVG